MRLLRGPDPDLGGSLGEDGDRGRGDVQGDLDLRPPNDGVGDLAAHEMGNLVS